jgi:hypothetical protein
VTGSKIGGMKAGRSDTSNDASASITTVRGDVVEVDFALERVMHLRRQALAAVRIEPTATFEGSAKPAPLRVSASLCEEDLARIDEATLEFAGRLMIEGHIKTPLIVPQSFFTVAARRGRQALAMMGDGRPDLLKTSVMVELVDVDKGTPISRLTEVAGLIASICRGVFIRVQPTRDMLAPVRGFRPLGVCLDGGDLAEDDAEAASQLLNFGEQALGAAPLLFAQGLPNDGFFQVAEVAGLTHGAVRSPIERYQRTAA